MRNGRVPKRFVKNGGYRKSAPEDVGQAGRTRDIKKRVKAGSAQIPIDDYTTASPFAESYAQIGDDCALARAWVSACNQKDFGTPFVRHRQRSGCAVEGFNK
jgi:hypothetical protein